MREILFRGFGITSRMWHEGELINTRGFIPPYMPIILEPDERSDGRAYDVYPESIGQFTGLTDKNGKKIFEGDVISCNGKTGYVNYTSACFCVHEMGHSKNNPAIDIVMNISTVKVIGNIHDDPELLEV